MHISINFKDVTYYVLMDNDETFNYFVEQFLERKALRDSETVSFTHMNREIPSSAYSQPLNALFNKNAHHVRLGTVLKNNTTLKEQSFPAPLSPDKITEAAQALIAMSHFELTQEPSSSYTPSSERKRIRKAESPKNLKRKRKRQS